MKIQLNEVCLDKMPKLSWLAQFDPSSSELKVFHGPAVECHDGWIVEGVWDGDFKSGGFHKTRNFFGSGIKVDEDAVVFVPSKALVDRIVYCHCDGQLLVSNSMLLLLAYTGARLDLHHDYTRESFAILKGIQRYTRGIVVDHPEINEFQQVFYHNLSVDSSGDLAFTDVEHADKITSYSDYLKVMREALGAIQKNYESPDRKNVITPLSTISSGYDSTAVTALAAEFGLKSCFTSRMSNSILPAFIHPKAAIDDGTPIAIHLGLHVEYLDNSSVDEDELYFLAASCAGPEMVFYKMAQHISSDCQAALVFTGYHGDVIWDLGLKPEETGKDIIRGDTSGFNLSEIRLKSGFVNAAIPFLFAHSIKDIVKISNSAEMDKWRLGNDYDRPIARRILEDKGISRQSFGFRKKGVTKYYNYPLNKKLRKRFFAFLKENYNISKFSVYLYCFLTKYPVLIAMGIFYNLGLKKIIDKNRRAGLRFSRLMYVWAVGRLAADIAAELQWPPFSKKN